MVKKVILGILVVGLLGILIFGAINRTNARLGDQAGWHNGQQAGERGGQQGGRGGGQGNQSARGDGAAQTAAIQWVTLDGSVVSVASDLLLVQATSGEIVQVEGMPWSFAQRQGFAPRPGDQVKLLGFYEDDELKVARLTNMSTGQTVLLRDENGRPMWAGQGRRTS